VLQKSRYGMPAKVPKSNPNPRGIQPSTMRYGNCLRRCGPAMPILPPLIVTQKTRRSMSPQQLILAVGGISGSPLRVGSEQSIRCAAACHNAT